MPEPLGTPRRPGTARAFGRRAAIGTAAASMAVVGMPGLALAAPPTTPFISEIHYDNAGADTGEFIEVHLPPGASSAGLSLALYNGSNNSTYGSLTPLPAVTAPADAPAVAVVTYPANGLQNGGGPNDPPGSSPDGIALIRDGAVLEFLSYEGVITAANGPALGTTSTDIGVAETGSEPAGQSLSRTYAAATDALVWTGPAAATPGAVNPTTGGETPGGEEPGGEEPGGEEPGGEEPGGEEPGGEAPGGACATEPTHAVGEVQGAGDVTPLAGSTVTVRGTVVGDLPGMSGFFVQDAGDANPATSDGIFVFSPAAVDLGDTVTVSGTPEEYFFQTQIGGGNTVTVCAEGAVADLPAATPLDLPADAAARERVEGMLVEPVDALTVSEVFDLTSFGDLTLSEGGLLVQPTELARPGPAAEAIAAQNQLRGIVLDDAVSGRVSVTTAPYLTQGTPVRVGDVLDFAEPLVLGFGFDEWRLFPADGSADGVFTPQDTRPDSPDAVGGDVQVGAFNVLNYFLTQSGPDARGATSQAAFERQAAKIVTAINTMDADVLALMEIEDTASTGFGDGSPDQAVADLVGRLNAAAGFGKWAFSPFPDELPATDRDVIRNAVIYQPASVTPVGDPVGLLDEVNFDNAREPLAQSFEVDGDLFTVVANHFKSKGSGSGANADQGDGQGASNPDRIGQAEALAGFVENLQVSTDDDDVMVLGDLNAYSAEDPIVILEEAGLTDLGTAFDAGRYSYVFDDMSGSLDHAMSTATLTAKVTDAAHWNINSVESFAYQYTGDPELYAPNQFRSSDHDPILVGLDLGDEVIDDGITELQLLGINDFHGRLGEAVGLAGTVAEQRERDDVDATLFLSSGDNIGASPFVSSSQQDAPTLEVLNEMGLQASAVGNHEFDRGFADLIDRVGVDGSGLADFPYLGANVYRDGAPALPEYALLDAGGVTVGVIGVVTQETASLVSPSGIEGITFGDPVAATNRVADELTDGVGDEADVLVLLAHEGAPANDSMEAQLAEDTAFAAIVNGADADIDAIFTGHTHQTYAWQAPVPGEAGTRPVIQTGSYAAALGRIVLSYDEVTGEVIASTVENLPITERTEEDLVAAYPSVAEVAETVAAAEAYAEEVGSVVIGSVTADITRAFRTGADGAQVEDRGSYSSLGGLVADTYVYGSELSAIEPADLGLVNPGGLRADLLYGEDGQITVAEANEVTPFANDLVVTTLTGAQLVQVLEQQWQPAGSSRPFLALSSSAELTYSYDPEAAAGERIDVDSIRISGEPIGLGADYRVATNSFLASGGDNFTAFAEGTTEGTGLIDFDSFQAYLEDFSPLSPEDYIGRVTIGTDTPGDGGGEVPGDGDGGGELPGDGDGPGNGDDGGNAPGNGNGNGAGNGNGSGNGSGGNGSGNGSGGNGSGNGSGGNGSGNGSGSGGTTTGGGKLAYTGAEVTGLVGLGLLLTAAGGALAVAVRRREHTAD